jgi:hypothetical protein
MAVRYGGTVRVHVLGQLDCLISSATASLRDNREA